MAVKTILKMGHPKLLEKSIDVDLSNNEEIQNIVADTLDTMRHAKGLGLAAPQIGINKRIIVYA